MARLRFRVTTIHLDENEDVSAVEAVVRDDTLVAVEHLIGAVRRAGRPWPSGAQAVWLDTAEIVKLFNAADKTTREHLCYEHTGEIYDSLSFIVYGLMDRD